MDPEDKETPGAPAEVEADPQDADTASVPDPAATEPAGDPLAMFAEMVMTLTASLAELKTLIINASWDTLNGTPVSTSDSSASSDPDNSENDEDVSIDDFFGTPQKEDN